MAEQSMRRHCLLMCLLLSLLTLAVYWQILTFEFVNIDDPNYITENYHVQTGLTGKGLVWAFSFTDVAYWHPMTWLSLMLDYKIYGLNPKGYHLTNLLLHTLSALFLFLALNRMTGSPWQSGLVAILFALHPLNVESVAWAVERKNVLSGLFWMLTLWSYARYVERSTTGRYLLVLIVFALGLMSKPTLVTLPFVLLLLDYWPLNRLQLVSSAGHLDQRPPTSSPARPAGGKSLPFRLVREKLPLFAISAMAIVITVLSNQYLGSPVTTDSASAPLSLRIGNGLISYMTYIGKMIWPANLAIYYPPPEAISWWQIAVAVLFILIVSLVVTRTLKTRPYLAVGWLWYLGTLVPAIGLVRAGLWPAMADRFAYVPLIGLFIMVAWGVSDFVEERRYAKPALTVAAASLLVSLMVCTFLQIKHWKNSLTLFEHALRVTEKNYLAHFNLGDVLEEKGDLEGASKHYSRAVSIKPDYAVAHNNLGEIKARQGMAKEAMSHYYQALKSEPDYAKPHNNLGIELAKQGKLQEAVFHLSRALEIEPSYADAHCNLGAVLARQGKIDEAIAHFSEALRINPDFARAYNNLGEALVRLGELDKAAFHFSRALKIEPSYADAHNNLGAVLARQGKIDEAMAHFSEALRINPNSVETLNNMGVILARQGKLQEAIGHFSRALQIEPDNLWTRENMNRVLEKKARRDVANE